MVSTTVAHDDAPEADPKADPNNDQILAPTLAETVALALELAKLLADEAAPDAAVAAIEVKVETPAPAHVPQAKDLAEDLEASVDKAPAPEAQAVTQIETTTTPIAIEIIPTNVVATTTIAATKTPINLEETVVETPPDTTPIPETALHEIKTIAVVRTDAPQTIKTEGNPQNLQTIRICRRSLSLSPP